MRGAALTIRRAGPADLPDVTEMVAEYWRFEGLEGFDARRVEAQLGRLVDDPRLGELLVARRSETSAGYVIAAYVFSLENLGIAAEIDELYVRAEHRSAGVGAALLEAAEAAAVRASCTNLYLRIGVANTRARDFYLRHGFRGERGYGLLEKDL